MLKRTITYTDYNGVERTEDHYFNLTKAELIMMEHSVAGGMKQRLEKIVQSPNSVEIMDIFRDIIGRSYGVKSDDGRRFMKSPQILEEFEQTEAYSELIVELFSDAEKMADFINKIIPKGILTDTVQALPPA